MKMCKYCNCQLKGNEKKCGNCGKSIAKKNSDLHIIRIIFLIICYGFLGYIMIFSKIESRKQREVYSNQVVESNILNYLNKKYNDNFEIVNFVKKGQVYDVAGNGFSFNDYYIKGTEYIEYIAKSKTTNITFKVAYINYSGINYYDFYVVKYAEKVYNEKINNLKFGPRIELDMDLNPQYINDLESKYYSVSNLDISFDDLDSIGLLEYCLIYDYPSEISIEDEDLFSDFISSINEVKKNINAAEFGRYVRINTESANIKIEVKDWTGNSFWDSYIGVLDKSTQRFKKYYYTENGYTHSS